MNEYWQKKPYVFKHALPEFSLSLSADELAGLTMDEDIESRLVLQDPWQLKNGPFSERDLTSLPDTPWTLLVQGVDGFIPEINALLDTFDFIPQWRLDDIMISLANHGGGVGPHYDNYDVFLYQAKGARQWSLTSKQCNESNMIPGLDLRIMRVFDTEEEHLLEEGDLLYLPAHIGHDGRSVSPDCMTYSFGYRSYQGLGLWDSFADYLSQHSLGSNLYIDPNWCGLKNTAQVPKDAVIQAKKTMQLLLDDNNALQHWFSSYVTQPSQQSAALLPIPMEENECDTTELFKKINSGMGLARDLNTRLAYHQADEGYVLYINGDRWLGSMPSEDCLKAFCKKRHISSTELKAICQSEGDKAFIFELYSQQLLTELTT